MIVMRIKGGLGNQLFQYAAAYSLSRRLAQPFAFDPSFTSNMTPRGYRLTNLKVSCDAVVDEGKLPRKVLRMKNPYLNKLLRLMKRTKSRCGDYVYYLERENSFMPDFFTISEENLFMDGYFQSEQYFAPYRKELLAQLRPCYEPEEAFLQVLKVIRGCNSVAVHVRRSDFKKDRCPYHYLLDDSYYARAVSLLRQKTENPQFFWFSDDMAWVEEHFGKSEEFHFVQIKTTHGDIDDMMLMKNCKHIITANSTFSWWAAWLNEHEDAVRVVPRKPFGIPEMIPETWIQV